MNAKGHLTVGIIVSTIVLALLLFFTDMNFSIFNLVFCPIIAILFCLLPDIDHPISTITYFFFGVGILGVSLITIDDYFSLGLPYLGNILIASVILLVVTFIFAKFVKHRGFVHTIWFGALCAGSIYFLTGQWQHVLIGFMSFYSHLAADGLWFKL